MTETKTIVHNRTAQYNYELLETFEAGIVLTGPEVKSIRAGTCSLSDCYGFVHNGYAFLENCYIAPYENSNTSNYEPKHSRTLLLHRREIFYIATQLKLKSLTLVVTKLYWKNGKVKVELALARGKKQFDKREAKKNQDVEREIQKQLKGVL